MTTEQIQTEQKLPSLDFYIPVFEVYVGGKKEGKKITGELKDDITNVSYTESLERIDSFGFTVSNWDETNYKLKYTDFGKEGVFTVGTEVEIRMGYAGNIQSMIFGEITTLEPNFPQSGYPTLDVRGLNVLHKLRKKQETHFYPGKTDKEIALQIAGRLGLETGEIEGSDKPNDFIVQNNRYDIVFLLERARRIGYEVIVDEEGKLNFKPSVTHKKESYVLKWGESLISFRPTLTTASQVAEVVVKGWNPKTKKPITGIARNKDIETQGLGTEKMKTVESAYQSRTEIIVDRPIRNDKEAENMAKEKLEQTAKELVKGEGTTIGLPDLRAGNIIKIEGLGEIFSGRYFVTGTTHSIGDAGYTTRFTVRREEVNKEKK